MHVVAESLMPTHPLMTDPLTAHPLMTHSLMSHSLMSHPSSLDPHPACLQPPLGAESEHRSGVHADDEHVLTIPPGVQMWVQPAKQQSGKEGRGRGRKGVGCVGVSARANVARACCVCVRTSMCLCAVENKAGSGCSSSVATHMKQTPVPREENHLAVQHTSLHSGIFHL